LGSQNEKELLRDILERVQNHDAFAELNFKNFHLNLQGLGIEVSQITKTTDDQEARIRELEKQSRTISAYGKAILWSVVTLIPAGVLAMSVVTFLVR